MFVVNIPCLLSTDKDLKHSFVSGNFIFIELSSHILFVFWHGAPHPADVQLTQHCLQSSTDTNIWDDDIVGVYSDTDSPSEPPANAQLLHYLRILWFSTRDQLEHDIGELGWG